MKVSAIFFLLPSFLPRAVSPLFKRILFFVVNARRSIKGFIPMKHWQTKLSEKRMMHSLNLMNVSCLSAQELFKKTRKISQMKVPGPEMRKEGRRGRKKERKIRKRTGIDVMEIGYKRVFVCPDFIIFIIDVHKSTPLLTSAVVIHENFSHLNLFPCEGKTINY